MGLPALRIYYKIVIPFILLFVAMILLLAYVSMSLLSRQLDFRLEKQIGQASQMVSQTDFALNPAILERLKRILDANIVSYRRGGTVVASTLAPDTDAEFLRLIQSPEITERIFERERQVIERDVTYGGQPYRIVYRPVLTPPGTLVAFVVSTADFTEAKATMTRTVSIIAVVMIVLMAAISHFIVRNITGPIHRLVEQTKQLAAGDWTSTVDVRSRDEIASLSRAFNEMAAQLRDSEDKLLHSEKLAVAGQLAARVAHDIRNPLSSTKMQAQLLRNRLKSDKRSQASVQAILDDIHRMEWVVQGLLDLARPGELQLRDENVNDILDDALAISAARLEHLHLAVEKQLEPDLPRLKLDANRFKQALLNVITNAVEAMPQGGNLLARTALDSHESAVLIEICDEGTGIAPNARDKLFDPFFTTKREGVGLGLVNTRSIVERHGGAITLEPRHTKGTCATIKLPLAPAGERAGSEGKEARPTESEEEAS